MASRYPPNHGTDALWPKNDRRYPRKLPQSQTNASPRAHSGCATAAHLRNAALELESATIMEQPVLRPTCATPAAIQLPELIPLAPIKAPMPIRRATAGMRSEEKASDSPSPDKYDRWRPNCYP